VIGEHKTYNEFQMSKVYPEGTLLRVWLIVENHSNRQCLNYQL